jgi:hypothetical protein
LIVSPGTEGAKVAFSQAVLDIFDLAARIARSDESGIHVEHLLVTGFSRTAAVRDYLSEGDSYSAGRLG